MEGSINSLLTLFCRGRAMSETPKCSQSCTRAVRLAGLIPLGQLSYLLAAPALPLSGSDAAVCSQRRGWNSQPADERPPSCPRRSVLLRVDTGVTEGQQQDAR